MAELMPGLDIYSQTLPQDRGAEQSVLGAVLIDGTCITRVTGLLRAEYFCTEVNRGIFGAMCAMFGDGQSIDIITAVDRCVKDGVFASREEAKGYLAQLAELVPTTANIEAYARLVREKYYLRRLIESSREIVDAALEPKAEAEELLEFAEQRIYDIREKRDLGELTPIAPTAYETFDYMQRMTGPDRADYLGLSTGYKYLDMLTTGLNRSDLILLAGRPGMGKTALGLNIASNVASAYKGKKAVALFSLEMSKTQLVQRLLSADARVESQKLRTGALTGEDWQELAASLARVSDLPIFLDDTAGITVPEMKAKLRRIRDLGLVVVDYLQLMTSGRRNENRVQEVSEMTRGLKIMAKELNVPVVVMSQLSRGTEGRQDKRPMLSDLRESGSIEQDADIVLMLYREAYYDRESDNQNAAQCIVAKNRHGETGTVDLFWDGRYTKFYTLEKKDGDFGG